MQAVSNKQKLLPKRKAQYEHHTRRLKSTQQHPKYSHKQEVRSWPVEFRTDSFQTSTEACPKGDSKRTSADSWVLELWVTVDIPSLLGRTRTKHLKTAHSLYQHQQIGRRSGPRSRRSSCLVQRLLKSEKSLRLNLTPLPRPKSLINCNGARRLQVEVKNRKVSSVT